MLLNPRYPVYVISKGRWESRLTSKVFERIHMPYRIVIEPQEADQYAAVIDPQKILILPFSNLGKGSIPARNWVWEHSIDEGHARHWIIDDNIADFYRFNLNYRIPISSGNIFHAMESFVDRYENVPMAGPNYSTFCPRRRIFPPFISNSRIYSCILLSNKVPHRWRGRYNEDTDLSLRFLKDGYCTIQFNAFLQDKAATMTVKGGNTDDLYKKTETFDGRLAMARSLMQQHPDVVKITRKYGRWQHQVDYSRFKRMNKLIRKPGLEIADSKVDEFGMELRDLRGLKAEQKPSRAAQRTSKRAKRASK